MMAQWLAKIDFRRFWNDDDRGVEAKGKKAAAAVRKVGEGVFEHRRTSSLLGDTWKQALDEIAWRFEGVVEVAEFDEILSELYDFGDLERIWIATTF
jgi:hypothetical protein